MVKMIFEGWRDFFMGFERFYLGFGKGWDWLREVDFERFCDFWFQDRI